MNKLESIKERFTNIDEACIYIQTLEIELEISKEGYLKLNDEHRKMYKELESRGLQLTSSINKIERLEQLLTKDTAHLLQRLEIAQNALEESTFVLNEIRDTKCNELAKRNMVILDQLKE